MSLNNSDSADLTEHWESVHVCPNCQYIINLADIDMRAITTGIVLCARCEWAGKIEIQIVGNGSPARN